MTPVAPFGIYHGTSTGETTWFGFGQDNFSELGLDRARVFPATTGAFLRHGPRPVYFVLGDDSCQGAVSVPLRTCSDALAASMTTVVAAELSNEKTPVPGSDTSQGDSRG